MRQPPSNVLDLPVNQRAEMALKAAVEDVFEEHMRAGLPVYVWRDGKLTEVTPVELKARSAPLPSPFL